MMTKEQVFEVLKLVNEAYPNFEVTQDKINIWHKFLKDQNPAIVMKNAEKHVIESKFPPTIADLREAASTPSRKRNEEHLEKMKRLRGETDE